MIVQVYRNINNYRILLCDRSYLSSKEGYEFLEEFEGEDWIDCNKKISKKYFNYNEFEDFF